MSKTCVKFWIMGSCSFVGFSCFCKGFFKCFLVVFPGFEEATWVGVHES